MHAREVNYITMTDLTRTINRDLMLAKKKTNSSVDDDFLTKRGGKVT